jgi:type III secretion protein J
MRTRDGRLDDRCCGPRGARHVHGSWNLAGSSDVPPRRERQTLLPSRRLPLWRKTAANSARHPSAAWAILVAILVSLALGGCKTDLYTKLNEREANEMVALLLGHGIEASRSVAKDGTSIVRVDDSRLAPAIELLRASGYPRQTFTNMGEVFKGSGLIASPTEERARFVYALSEELSRTVSDIDGVLSARIHVVLPKNDLLRQDTTPSSASVFIRHDTRAPLKNLLPQIKMLVANSIEGLSYEKVSVVLVPVDRTEALSGGSPSLAADLAAGSRSGRAGAGGAAGDALTMAVGLGLAGLALGAGAAYWFGRRRRVAPQTQPALDRQAGAPTALAPPSNATRPASRPEPALPSSRQVA